LGLDDKRKARSLLDQQEAYWQRRFSGDLPVSKLWPDHPRPPVSSYTRGVEDALLFPDLYRQLQSTCARHKVSLFVLLLAAFKTLLHRYTLQADIIVAVPSSDSIRWKDDKGGEPFSNLLALRSDLTSDPTFAQLLISMAKTVQDAAENRDYPFENLLQQYDGVGVSPIFGFCDGSPADSIAPITERCLLDLQRYSNRSDLVFLATRQGDSVALQCQYDTELFEPATIARLLGHYVTLLDGIAANPGHRISQLPLLTERETHQILAEWNDTQTEYPKDKCIHRLFEEQVDRTPDATAVVYEDQQLTYRELNNRANQLAHYLHRQGVQPDTLVALCMERSIEMIVGLLGILKAGGAYVPLDPTYPEKRLAFMLHESSSPVLVTQQAFIDEFIDCSARMIFLDTDWEKVRQESERNLIAESKSDSLAYVIYTSGSTGQPKGVAVPHQAVNRLVINTDYVQVRSSDVIAQASNVSFDAATFEIWGALLNGARLVLITKDTLLSPQSLSTAIARYGITTLFLTTALFNQMVEQIPAALGKLRFLLFGGEAVDPERVKELVRIGPPSHLLHVYGPTETTTFATWHRIKAIAADATTVPIGRPIANTEIYILDPYLNPVPIGVAGELHIGGDGLARGYLHRPELTVEKFIANPFNNEPEARLYKTGDLARYLADGTIDFLGRIDSQVKIRGYRIEPGEIESVLAQHSAIQQAVVLAREDSPGDKRLVAYVVAAVGCTPSLDALRSFLQQKLPDYMVPSAFMFLDSLPLTPNGKLDRKALPTPDQSRPELENAFAAPRTATEGRIAKIWAEVLGFDPIGIHDDFLALGGHSLRAIQIVARLRNVLNKEVFLNDIFSNPTIAELADILDKRAAGSESLTARIQPVERNLPSPLSFSQERAWFIQQLHPSNRAYHFQALLYFTGRLDVNALERSLSEIIRRHEIFRTTFPVIDGNPVQDIHGPFSVSLPITDLQELPDHEREAALQTRIREEIHKSFDLNRLPLVRWALVQLKSDEFVLIDVEHHLVHDGWSFNVFLQELLEIYGAFSAGDASPLTEATLQFADFAHWQRLWMKGENARQQLAYWKRQLTGSPSLLALATDHPRPPIPSLRGAAPRFDIPPALSDSLRGLSRQQGVTLFMTMFAAFIALLHRYTRQDDICVGTAVGNRRWKESEGLIGMLVNNVVLRTSLAKNPRMVELLTQVRAVMLDAYANEDIPFDQVVRALEIQRDNSRNPIFQVMFSFHDSPLHVPTLPGIRFKCVEGISNQSAKFDLNVIVIPRSEPSLAGRSRENAMTLVWEYSSDLFEPDTIERMVGHYQTLLEGIVADPNQRVSDLSLMTDAERHQLLIEWNDTHRDLPKDKYIHQLFEEQVEKTPDAIALVFEDQQLTYGELNSRANQLAHYLQKLGVGPDVFVAICLERSIGMIIGLLAILKAGGAYVPIDPGYPQEWLALVLADSRSAVVLTQKLFSDSFRSAATAIISLDTDRDEICKEKDTNPAMATSSDNLAYVLYTSGSTGAPKGVAVEHRNTVAFLSWAVSAFAQEDLRVVLASTSISFDLSVFEIFATLSSGGKIVLAQNALALAQLPNAGEVTLINTVPSAITELVKLRAIPSSVRVINLAGEPLQQALVQQIYESSSVGKINDLYGPTECTTYSTWTYRRLEGRQTIGRPIANTKIYILDSQRTPVPIGVPGEIYIGGAGVARGYLNRPELTAEKFIDNPFSSEPGARLYKTGDLARYLPDGNIEYLGRIDNQVKIRGFRIELGEIETVLAQHLAIQQAVVLAREDTPSDQRLVAYVVTADGSAPSAHDLRIFLQQKLPAFMVPSSFLFLDSLPLTSNGKLDRTALPAPDQARPELDNVFVAPRTAVEELLANIWCTVLKIDKVGIHDNFFHLGGHSLLAMRVIEGMRRTGLQADVRTLFITPTLAELAAAVGGNSSVVEVPPNRIPPGCKTISPDMLPLVNLSREEIERVVMAVPGGAANVQDIYPLAPLQEGILFHHLLARDRDVDPYLLFDLTGFDSRARLESYLQALQAVIERHDILRTAVLWEGLPEPVQVVCRRARLIVEEVRLDAADGDICRQLRARFDTRHHLLQVSEAPLLRVFIAHDAANARWLMLQLFHHLAIDHATLKVMQQEIQALLLGQAGQLPAPLPFRNFVAQSRLGVSREEHEAFFRKMLGDVDEPTAPFGLIDVQGDGSGIKQARRPVDPLLARRLRKRVRALGVSAASVCHLAWAQVLARLSGRDDVVFGTLLFGRMQGGEATERVLGLFVNTLPVRVRISDETVQESLRVTHMQLAQLLRHEHASLALAQRCTAVVAPTPLFSALLNYRHSTAASQVPVEALQAWEGVEFLGGEERTNYPLTLTVDDLGESFALTAQVQSPLDPERICAYMHAAMEQLVGALESTRATSTRSLDVLPDAERHQLLVEWNDTRTDYPKDKCVHQLFEEQVERTPDAIAVVYEDRQLTYRELNNSANQLAHYLRRQGVQPETLVAICMERSIDMIVGLLGILKAGGAYVPLDPGYPKERLGFMLEDTQAGIVLTDTASRNRLQPAGARIIVLDRNREEFAKEPQVNPISQSTAIGLAYVIYTSGSTGVPKGIEVRHRGVVRLLLGVDYVQVDTTRTFLHLAPISFDAATFEVWGALLHGGKCVLFPGKVTGARELGEVLKKHQVTTLWLTAALFNTVINEQPQALSEVKQLLIGGETLTVRHVKKGLAELPNTAIINGYGPTESTTFTCCYPIPRQLDDNISSIPIGKPIGNTQVYILDSHLNPVPIGVPGELHIGGDGLARGYLNRPELTAETFIANPFSNEPEARLYKTGDLARYLADGTIDFLGRIDSQVKIRGYRIEPGEIETVLAQHPAIQQAAVLAREDTPGDQRLVAYVVAAAGRTPSLDALRSFLQQKLPDYMVPSAFVFLDSLPFTPNGKLDRKALPTPDQSRPELEDAFAAPRTAVEETLAIVWSEVLKLDKVGIHDNFFHLGGHSLLATKVVSRIRGRFGFDLPLREIFAAPTIAALALKVQVRGNNDKNVRGPTITRVARKLYKSIETE
jgi:amino acid adenylation domain-containing protein